LQSELTGLETKLKYAQDELKALERNIDSKNKELKYVRSQLAEVQPKYDEQANGVETLRQQLEEYTSAIHNVEDDIFGTFCQRLGYANIRAYEKQQGSMQEEANKRKIEFTRQISRLENQLSFEKQRVKTTEARIKDNEAHSTQHRETIAQLEEQKEALGTELDELNAEIDELKEQLAAVRTDYDERGEKVNEARSEVQKRSRNVEKTLKEVAALETDVQTASNNRYTVLRQCKVENIELPLERGSRKVDALPLEDAILEQEQEDEDAMDVDEEEGGASRTPQFNDYGIRIDFSDLDDDLKEDGSDECEAALLEKITTLTAELDKMAPNMRSAERLEATQERFQAVERDYKDATKAAMAAKKAFDEVKTKRQDYFNKAFAHISDQIGPVYRELTKTASFPVGGTATLTTEEDDEPYLSGINYSAMPPLKRFRGMEHLSGGEKTMAALALLFAVHTYAPSPFFVLDEVDAALDNANTAQLANYVREHAGPGMQFVVISLKTGLFQNSETLVGVMRDQGVNSSRALTLDVSFFFLFLAILIIGDEADPSLQLRKYQAVA
jgi:structural maintenance of chromosome 1